MTHKNLKERSPKKIKKLLKKLLKTDKASWTTILMLKKKNMMKKEKKLKEFVIPSLNQELTKREKMRRKSKNLATTVSDLILYEI